MSDIRYWLAIPVLVFIGYFVVRAANKDIRENGVQLNPFKFKLQKAYIYSGIYGLLVVVVFYLLAE